MTDHHNDRATTMDEDSSQQQDDDDDDDDNIDSDEEFLKNFQPRRLSEDDEDDEEEQQRRLQEEDDERETLLGPYDESASVPMNEDGDGEDGDDEQEDPQVRLRRINDPLFDIQLKYEEEPDHFDMEKIDASIEFFKQHTQHEVLKFREQMDVLLDQCNSNQMNMHRTPTLIYMVQHFYRLCVHDVTTRFAASSRFESLFGPDFTQDALEKRYQQISGSLEKHVNSN
jgi:hypothetical protein